MLLATLRQKDVGSDEQFKRKGFSASASVRADASLIVEAVQLGV